jgi:hypothetical protein
MKYALAIALSLLAGAAQAQQYAGWNVLPPLDTIIRMKASSSSPGPTNSFWTVLAQNRRGKEPILGCAYRGKNENGDDQCWLILANDDVLKQWKWPYGAQRGRSPLKISRRGGRFLPLPVS